MSTQISNLAMLLVLAACSKGEDKVAQAPAADRVQCAVDQGRLAADCAIERQGGTITVRHSDGSFRRFEIDAAGQFGAADGAEEVSGRRNADGSVDVMIGERRYRFGPDQLKP